MIPRDGTWAGSATTQGVLEDGLPVTMTEQASFQMRRRAITAFDYQLALACYNRDSRSTYDVYFGPAKRSSLGQLRPGLERRFSFRGDDGSGRKPQVVATLNYRGSRARLSLRATWRGAAERCSGRVTLPLTRGPLPPE